MTNQFSHVEDLWNEKQSLKSAPTFIMHWRRNVLRRMISDMANNYDKQHRGSDHQAHPETAAKAQGLANYKPKVQVTNLVQSIEKEFHSRRAVAKKIKKHELPTC